MFHSCTKMRRVFSAALCCAAFFWPGKGNAAQDDLKNVAGAGEGAVAIADSEFGSFTASLAIDGKAVGPGDAPDANRWHAAPGKPHPHWLWIRFRQPARITKAVIHRADILDYPVDLVGEFSPDGGLTFTTLFSRTNNQMSKEQFTIEESFPATVTDNFRVRIVRSSNRDHADYAQLSEVEVFGEPVAEKPTCQARSTQQGRLGPPELKPTAIPGLETAEHDAEIEFRSKWLRLDLSKRDARITALCWDSLGEGKVNENLLKSGTDGGARLSLTPLFPDFDPSGAVIMSNPVSVEREGNMVRYSQGLPGGVWTRWEIRVGANSFEMAAAAMVPGKMMVREPLSAEFVFDVGRTPVAPLTNPRLGMMAPLPCLLHAADFGSLLVRPTSAGTALCLAGQPVRPLSEWRAWIGKPEKGRSLDGLFTLPGGPIRWKLKFTVEAVTPMPELAEQEPRLRELPRSWLNTFQFRPDIGILANNIVSDNAIFCMFTFTDPAVFTPTLPGKIEAIQLARESLEQYFANAPGYGVGQEDVLTDTYPSLFIAAWDVIRVTGDRDCCAAGCPSWKGWPRRPKRKIAMAMACRNPRGRACRGARFVRRAIGGTKSTSATRTPMLARFPTAGIGTWRTWSVWPGIPHRQPASINTPNASAPPLCRLFSTRRQGFWAAGETLAEICTITGLFLSTAWPSLTDWSRTRSPMPSLIALRRK